MQKENRNNRVHTGEQSGKTDFLIERLLPVGKENAITTQDLVKLSGCGSARELQQRIAYEREQGAIICSGSGRGYWRPKDRQEIQEFVHTMNARALNTLKAVKSAKRALKVVEGIGDGRSKARKLEKTPSEKDRLKAAELIGKRYGLFTDKIETDVDMDLNITIDYGDE